MLFFLFFILSAVISLTLGIVYDMAFYFVPLIFVAFLIGFNLLFVLVLLICGLFLPDVKSVTKESKFCRVAMNLAVSWLVPFFVIKSDISGEEQIPKDRPFVLVQNHVSGFDPIITYNHLRKIGCRISYIAKISLFRKPIVGKYLYNGAFLPIDKDNIRTSVKSISTASDYITDFGLPIGIYPEGKRSYDGKLLDFKNGAFKIAKKSKCDIVVTSIKGTGMITKNYPWKRTFVSVKVLGVIPKEKVEVLSLDEISEMSREMIRIDLGQ